MIKVYLLYESLFNSVCLQNLLVLKHPGVETSFFDCLFTFQLGKSTIIYSLLKNTVFFCLSLRIEIYLTRSIRYSAKKILHWQTICNFFLINLCKLLVYVIFLYMCIYILTHIYEISFLYVLRLLFIVSLF